MIVTGWHDRDPNAEARHSVVDMTVRPHNETRSMNASYPRTISPLKPQQSLSDVG
jgi:hypothetical protein